MMDPQNRMEGAAGRLLERELPEGYRSEWTSHLSRQKTANAVEMKSVLVFRVGDSLLALPTSLVDVVAENSPFHSIPRRRSGIAVTLANVRGELLICVSLAALLGIETAEPGDSSGRRIYPHLVSCRKNDQRFAFPVDAVCGVEKYPVDQVHDVPATLSGSAANYTRGLIVIGDRTIGLIDDELFVGAWGKSLL